MSTPVLIEELTRQQVKLWVEGDQLRYRGPQRALTAETLAQLKANKLEIVRMLAEETFGSPAEVLAMFRERFDTQPFNPDEHPPPPGLIAQHDTDKAKLFRKGDGWRECWPRDFKVYRGRNSA